MRPLFCILALLLPCCGGSDPAAPEGASGSTGDHDAAPDQQSAGAGGQGGSAGSAGTGGTSGAGGDDAGSEASATGGTAGVGGSGGNAGSAGSAGSAGTSGAAAYSVCNDAPNVGGSGYVCNPACTPAPKGYSAYCADSGCLYAARCVHPTACDQSDKAFLVPAEGSPGSGVAAVLLGPLNCVLNYKVPVRAEGCVKVTVSSAPGSPAWGVSLNRDAADDAKPRPRCLVHCYTKPDITSPNQEWMYVRGDFKSPGGDWIRAESSATWSGPNALKCP